MRLHDKIAIVTGAGSGFGAGIARKFAAEGARVAFSYLTSEAEARELSEKTGAVGLSSDLTRPEASNELVEAVKERLGPVEILVANTGGLIERKKVVDCDLELWNQCLSLNLTSAFLSCKAVIPDMLAARSGIIVTISSLAAHNGGGFSAVHYGTAKGGLYTFTKGLAREVGPDGIRVNGVAPGLIATRFHDIHSTDETRKATVDQTPLRREGTPADVAGAVIYVASAESAFLAGEIIEVNGGVGLF